MVLHNLFHRKETLINLFQITSEKRIDLLYEAAQEAIERGEDFCFRKMYLPGKSNQEELLKYITESESGENL